LISWINGELVELRQTNQKFFVLINCQGLGYEIQILESFFLKLKTNQIPNKKITLWIKHIKKEDSDLLFGFKSKDQKNFFTEILNIRGVGSQIGMGILNKFSIIEVMNAIRTQNKKLICSVPGIGQKMSERLILELKSKFKSEIQIEDGIGKYEFEIKDPEISKMMEDLELTLQSLNYKGKEIKNILPIILKEIDLLDKKENNLSFESLGASTNLPIQLEAKVNEYLSLVMKLIFAFGLSFQLPVVLSLLARIGVINSTFLKERRKYVVVMIFAAAAILTPPDPITQIGLAVPLLILYELSIFSVKIIENKNFKKSDA